MLAASPHAGAVDSSKLLVFGGSDNGFEGNNAAQSLRDLGFDVDRTTALPADLSAYASIWYISAYAGLPAPDATRLADFISAGGSAYLTGERPCCDTLNATITQILDQVLKNQNVQVGGLGDIDGPFAFNPDVTDYVARVPNLLSDFIPHSPGGMAGIGGVTDRNVFASNAGVPVGAVWNESDMKSGHGRIALLMDIDWLGDPARSPIIENIANFLGNGGLCTDDQDSGIVWNSGPAGCSTLMTPGTFDWTVSSGAGVPDITVSQTGVTANCTMSVVGTARHVSCAATNAAPSGASLRLKATAAGKTSVRYFRLRPKNDPRNVPIPFNAESNWWDWPDNDSDGLPDKWEQDGVYVKNKFLNLPSLGANPNKKDLFLHYDFQEGKQPSTEQVNEMVSQFANSPLTNPDGSHGLKLHVEIGSSVPNSIVGDFDLSQQNLIRVTNYTGFLKSPEVGGEGVPPIYKWLLNFDGKDSSKHRLCGGKKSSGCAGVKGEFGWTASNEDAWNAALNVNLPVWNANSRASALAFEWAAVANHELGHLLGLLHHGSSPTPDNDSNYKSIMSYAYSHYGLPGDGILPLHHLDYSRTNTVNLDWRLGSGNGQLTFIFGQWGNVPDFYANSNSEELPPSEGTPTELDELESLKAAAPDSLDSFIDAFDVPADPHTPTLDDLDVVVTAGSPVTLDPHGASPNGAPVTYLVDDGPLHGSAIATSSGISYSASAGFAGDDKIIVRATNGVTSSRQATLTVHVVGAAGASFGTQTAPGCKLPAATGSATLKLSKLQKHGVKKVALKTKKQLGKSAKRKTRVLLMSGCKVVASGFVKGKTIALVVSSSGTKTVKRHGKKVHVKRFAALHGTFLLVQDGGGSDVLPVRMTIR